MKIKIKQGAEEKEVAYQEDIENKADADAENADVLAWQDKLNVSRITELWSNPNPSASFAGQTITLSDADWDYVVVCFNLGDTNPSGSKSVVIIAKSDITIGGGNTVLSALTRRSNGTVWLLESSERKFNFDSYTSIIFYNGSYTRHNANTASADNSVIIPTKILGIKGVSLL